MICKNCGTNNHIGAKFCGKCGTKLYEENALNEVVAVCDMEDGFFFKGVSFPKKILIYAFGVFLVFLVAAYTFACTDLKHFLDMISYLSRFFS
ncbi:MAG: zinc ribbon domain-containing protein [Lachnospirales bacterium]